MEINGEDLLALLNRLLEGLHQAGLTNFGSHLSIIYVAPGAQYVGTVQNQYQQASAQNLTPNPSRARSLDTCYQWDARKGEGNETTLPEVSTEEAMALWRKAQEAGYVDEHYQPKISRTQAALLANAMAERLGIREKWKTFETLWNRKNMYRDYYKALNLQQSLAFQDKIKTLFR